MKWEYKCLEFIPLATTTKQAEALCNELGQQGWEMCQGKAGFWFRRSIEDDSCQPVATIHFAE